MGFWKNKRSLYVILGFCFLFFWPKSFAFSSSRIHRYSFEQDSILPEFHSYGDKKTELFFDSLRIKAGKNRWAKQLHDIVILPPRNVRDNKVATQKINLKYIEYSGLKIRSVSFLRLDPFGSLLEDTSYTSDSWTNRVANALHIKTQETILRKHLLIKENDLINPDILSDNERIIRELPFIHDVRIIVTTDASDPGYADLLFVVKDLWSKAFFPELKEVNSGKLELWDRNLFGMGNEFQNSIHWDPGKSDFWGYEAFYKTKNIFGSFIDSKLYYQNVFETESYGIDVSKKFLTPEIRYAGGFQAYKMKTIKNIWINDSTKAPRSLNYNYSDIWLGRSFHLKNSFLPGSKRVNIIIASRLITTNYLERPPEVESRLMYEYHSRSLWLNSLSLSAQDYYQSNLIYSYGRTEDIPYGWSVSTTMGKEFSEYDDRLYTALSLRHGDYIGPFGYFFVGSSIGGFINNKKSFEQGSFQFNLNYFTKLFILDQFKFRHFIYINYLRGLNRFPLESININDKSGIRGLSVNEIYGQQKLTSNLESVIFTPYKPYGFNFVFFGFADLALIAKENVSLKNMDFYSGFGFGIRIRNERLVFPTFQFRFSFYPGIENLAMDDFFQFSGEKKLKLENFSTTSPAILPFY